MREKLFFLFLKRDNLIIYVLLLAQHETKYTNTKHGKIKYLLTYAVKKNGYAPCVASIIAIIVQPPNPLRFHCITLLFGSMVTSSLFHWDDNR